MLITTLLQSTHDRESFSCGKSMLDIYLQNQAGQDVKRKLAVVFVLGDPPIIKAYYTLSNYSIPRSEVPEEVQKIMPPTYSNLPVTLLGRLAVDTKFQGQKLGEDILIDALERTYLYSENHAGSIAVIVDPLDEEAKKFYEKYGFVSLPTSGKMLITMKTIKALFS